MNDRPYLKLAIAYLREHGFYPDEGDDPDDRCVVDAESLEALLERVVTSGVTVVLKTPVREFLDNVKSFDPDNGHGAGDGFPGSDYE